MKTATNNRKTSDTILYVYLICACWATVSYFVAQGQYFALNLQMALLVFLFVCTLLVVQNASADSFYLPPLGLPVSNKRWKKCIDWWSKLPDDELARNIGRLNAMNRKNADTLLRVFEHLELFEKCSVIKRTIG
ncbi:hypothetical protein [Emticicia sp. 17c]|uniref:hypothetical protein n=1 Tax=Emticicia sp. 17c TaxID=3127704 RepID=UPI00301C4726